MYFITVPYELSKLYKSKTLCRSTNIYITNILFTDGKLSVYGSLPRRSHYIEDEQIPQDVIHDMNYLRTAPNVCTSLATKKLNKK
jgi:hypothetical protein